jgi:hypothetical protein
MHTFDGIGTYGRDIRKTNGHYQEEERFGKNQD